MIKTIVVDDEPAALERYAAYVAEYGRGFSVAARCRCAAEAFAAAQADDPDLLLTDIRMPGEDGLSLLARLRDSGWKGRAVVISGYDDFAYAQRAIRLGVFDFLLKPVFPEDMRRLLAKVEAALEPCGRGRPGSGVGDFVAALLPSSRRAAPGDAPESVRKVLAFIESHCDARFSLDEAARAAGASPAWLSSRFKQIYGCSLMEYARVYRMAKACELLSGGDIPLKEIADLLAFPDLPTFAKLFRRIAGVSPGAYRKAARSAAALGEAPGPMSPASSRPPEGS
jgi:two-component system, response regulator YesN